MPGIAQRRTRLSGQVYEKGEAVPDELVTGRNVASGLVVRSAESDADLAAELERTKAELAEVKAKLAARERAEASAGAGQGTKPPKAPKAARPAGDEGSSSTKGQ